MLPSTSVVDVGRILHMHLEADEIRVVKIFITVCAYIDLGNGRAKSLMPEASGQRYSLRSHTAGCQIAAID